METRSGESNLNFTLIIQLKLRIQYNICKPSADVQFSFQCFGSVITSD